MSDDDQYEEYEKRLDAFLKKYEYLSGGDNFENIRTITDDSELQDFRGAYHLMVYDRILDFVDMTLSWEESIGNPNYVAHNFLKNNFFSSPKTGNKYGISFVFKIFFPEIRNKTKFLFMVAYSNLKLHHTVYDFLGNHLSTECDTGVLVAFIIKSLNMNQLPDSIFQFGVKNTDKYFFNDPSSEITYLGIGEKEYSTVSASNILAGSFDLETMGIKHLKLIYPSFRQILTMGRYNGIAFEYDIWISRNWSKKWIINYYDDNSMSLFTHIPNKKVYDLLLSSPDVKISIKQRLISNYDNKPAQIESFINAMSRRFDQANHSIPDILPDEVKRIILEKTIKASFGEWRHHACTFHADEDGEGTRTFNTILNNIFSSPKKDDNDVEMEDVNNKKKRRPANLTGRGDRGKTKMAKTNATSRSFTIDQKKAIKRLAKKYKQAFEEFKSP